MSAPVAIAASRRQEKRKQPVAPSTIDIVPYASLLERGVGEVGVGGGGRREDADVKRSQWMMTFAWFHELEVSGRKSKLISSMLYTNG
eukprot:915171-Rhodomonas_salina.3